VVDLPLLDGVSERPDHVFLADDVGERPGTVAAVERGTCGHGTVESSGVFGRAAGRLEGLEIAIAEHHGCDRHDHEHHGAEDCDRRHIRT
jgi:hypothetical protein